jgi:glycosyltransferase involved in cell wall biosynthesis
MSVSERPVAQIPRKIRVLLITDEMETGGTQRQIVHIARNLDSNRFEPAVAYFRNRSFLVDELERAGIPVHYIPKRRRVDIGFLLRLVALLRNERFDVVHCFSFTGELWGALARRLMLQRNKPVLITSVRNTYDWYTGWQWMLKRWASLESYVVVANSHTGAEYAREKMRLEQRTIQVVYNGVAPVAGGVKAEECISIRHALDVPVGTVLGIFVGRLVVQKNVPVLLRAVKRIAPMEQGFRLLIVGSGPLQEQIEAQIEALDLSQTVKMLGHRSDAERLVAASDFLVLPSLREGLSNVILEAMMAGKAVIASNVGGNSELVGDQQNGLLFDKNDEAGLANCLRALITDEAKRSRFGAAGRARANEEFGIPVMARAMESHYVQCISTRNLAPIG